MNKLTFGFLLYFIHIQVFSEGLTAYATINTTTSSTVTSSPQRVSAEEFTRKYWKDRDNTPVIINDSLGNLDRLDLNNKHYYISYNKKCFTAQPLVNDFDVEPANPNEESAGLLFTRVKSCSTPNGYFFANKFFISLAMTVSDKQARTNFTSVTKSPIVLIDHLISLNSFKSTLTSDFTNRKKDAELLLRYQILCPGKVNSIYEFTLVPENYQEQLDFVTKHNYKLPDDIMQIISTFKCRKDR